MLIWDGHNKYHVQAEGVSYHVPEHVSLKIVDPLCRHIFGSAAACLGHLSEEMSFQLIGVVERKSSVDATTTT